MKGHVGMLLDQEATEIPAAVFACGNKECTAGKWTNSIAITPNAQHLPRSAHGLWYGCLLWLCLSCGKDKMARKSVKVCDEGAGLPGWKVVI